MSQLKSEHQRYKLTDLRYELVYVVNGARLLALPALPHVRQVLGLYDLLDTMQLMPVLYNEHMGPELSVAFGFVKDVP